MPLLKIKNSDLDIVMALDPAISERAKAARSAIICLGMSPSARIFVLEYWVGRQGDPGKLIETMLDMAYEWNPRAIGIEAIAYQQALLPFTQRIMQQRGKFWSIIPLKPDRNTRTSEKKNQRILSMQPYFQAGQIFIQKGMLDLIEEYETFPLGRTVDLLDAMAYAVRMVVPQVDLKQKPGQGTIERLQSVDPTSARYWRTYQVSKGFMEPEPNPLEEDSNTLQEEQYQRGVGELI